MAFKTITSANAILIATIIPDQPVIAPWLSIQIQDFAVDDAWSSEAITYGNAEKGVDGAVGAYRQLSMAPFAFSLMANSKSIPFIEAYRMEMDRSQEIIAVNFTLQIPSLKQAHSIINATPKTMSALATGKSSLQPLSYTFLADKIITSTITSLVL